jgi:hypothetical protein
MLVGLFGPCAGQAIAGVTTNSTSTSHHRYDVYLGKVELVRAGETTPYRTVSAFESEIRFDQEAVDQIAAALPQDSGFASGIANTTAPDGGSWITSAKRPAWWDRPDGTDEDQPLFDAQAQFASVHEEFLAAGEGASCTDSEVSEAVLQDDPATLEEEMPVAVAVSLVVGPGVAWVGPDRSEELAVPNGDSNINAEFSYLVLAVHRLRRTCVVSPPTNPPAPKVTPDRCVAAPDVDHDGIADACDEDPTIPDSCALRVARSRVFVYRSKPKARLVVKYKTRSPARVKTTYTATLSKGKKLVLGSLKKQFGSEGTFKLPVSFEETTATKVRSAKSFTVTFSIPGAPKACAAAYTKQLTKKTTAGKQAVWFQSDSVLSGLF